MFNPDPEDRYAGVSEGSVENYSVTGKYYMLSQIRGIARNKTMPYNLYRKYPEYVNDNNDYSIINYIRGTVSFLNKYGKTILINDL